VQSELRCGLERQRGAQTAGQGRRETRVAARLRAVEHAYRMAVERDAVFGVPEPTKARQAPEHAADKEIELE
jgi:hypothetical protein